jgi:PTH1 family peptidyl-tRNA hydrolase
MVLREIAGRLATSFSDSGFSETAKGIISPPGGQRVEVLLVRPLTYMNTSGQAVLEAARDHGLSPSDILVIHDDMDLPFGKIRIRRKGSSGGHKGIESIAAHLDSTEFPRVKVGVGRPPAGVDPVEFVLKPFSRSDARTLEDEVWLAAAAAESVFTRGIDWAMGEYNGHGPEEDGETK